MQHLAEFGPERLAIAVMPIAHQEDPDAQPDHGQPGPIALNILRDQPARIDRGRPVLGQQCCEQARKQCRQDITQQQCRLGQANLPGSELPPEGFVTDSHHDFQYPLCMLHQRLKASGSVASWRPRL